MNKQSTRVILHSASNLPAARWVWDRRPLLWSLRSNLSIFCWGRWKSTRTQLWNWSRIQMEALHVWKTWMNVAVVGLGGSWPIIWETPMHKHSIFEKVTTLTWLDFWSPLPPWKPNWLETRPRVAINLQIRAEVEKVCVQSQLKLNWNGPEPGYLSQKKSKPVYIIVIIIIITVIIMFGRIPFDQLDAQCDCFCQHLDVL